MLTRRLVLLSTAAAFASPAVAQPRRSPANRPAPPGGRSRTHEPAPTGSPADTPLGPVDTVAKWAFIQDFTTGTELLNKAADEEMPPSSMTKLMTIYLVYERLKQGRLKLDDELPVSERAWRMGGSKMFVMIGTQVKVEDLIRGIIVDSGNDACIVLAEALAGSEEQFVELMNQKAKQFGMTHTHYVNCTGWPDPDQHMSARDIATLAGHIIRDFPEYYHYDSEKTFRYNGIEQGNRNTMVQKGTADGLKTGHTEAGGYGLVASTLRGKRRVVMVLNGMDTMRERMEESDRLMDWAFANFEDVTLYTAGAVVDDVPVWLGTAKTVPMVSGRDIIVTMPRNWRDKAQVKVHYTDPLKAPVAKGDTIGSLTVGGDGVPALNVPLLAGADVPRLGLPGRAMAVIMQYLGGSGGH
jgi:D-alanyl-D-alanine carboxypeptidase (penicillin-binding protein 5/6)